MLMKVGGWRREESEEESLFLLAPTSPTSKPTVTVQRTEAEVCVTSET